MSAATSPRSVSRGQRQDLTTGGGRGRAAPGNLGVRQLWVTVRVRATGRARRPLVGPGSRLHRLTPAAATPHSENYGFAGGVVLRLFCVTCRSYCSRAAFRRSSAARLTSARSFFGETPKAMSTTCPRSYGRKPWRSTSRAAPSGLKGREPDANCSPPDRGLGRPSPAKKQASASDSHTKECADPHQLSRASPRLAS